MFNNRSSANILNHSSCLSATEASIRVSSPIIVGNLISDTVNGTLGAGFRILGIDWHWDQRLEKGSRKVPVATETKTSPYLPI